jgi:hypothetical protein
VKGGTKQASIASHGQPTSPADPGDALNPDTAGAGGIHRSIFILILGSLYALIRGGVPA